MNLHQINYSGSLNVLKSYLTLFDHKETYQFLEPIRTEHTKNYEQIPNQLRANLRYDRC